MLLLQASKNKTGSTYKHNHSAVYSIMWFVIPRVKVKCWVLRLFNLPPISGWKSENHFFYIGWCSTSFHHHALQTLNETFSDRWLGNGCLILMPPWLPNFTPSFFCVCQVSIVHTKNQNSPHAIKTFITHTHTHTHEPMIISLKCWITEYYTYYMQKLEIHSYNNG
jgi:hypothetical protein